MTATKQRYGKFGGNVAFHAFQSFQSGEVTPEEHQEKLQAAREITKKIKPLREQLKTADSALQRFPKVWSLLKTEHDMEIEARNKIKSKGFER